MIEMNATQDQGTPATHLASGANGDGGDTTARLYPDKASAEAAKPADASKSLRAFEVLHNGTSKGWVLARGHANAIEQVARLDGYSATTGGSTAVSKEAILSKLGTLTDAELATMGLTRRPARGRK